MSKKILKNKLKYSGDKHFNFLEKKIELLIFDCFFVSFLNPFLLCFFFFDNHMEFRFILDKIKLLLKKIGDDISTCLRENHENLYKNPKYNPKEKKKQQKIEFFNQTCIFPNYSPIS
jgi:hypothetical protein